MDKKLIAGLGPGKEIRAKMQNNEQNSALTLTLEQCWDIEQKRNTNSLKISLECRHEVGAESGQSWSIFNILVIMRVLYDK